MKKFVVTGIQMDIKPGDIQSNLKTVINLTEKTLKFNPDMIIFPEMFATGFAYPYINKIAKDYFIELTTFLTNLSYKTNAHIIGGSIPEIFEGKLYNTSIVFSPDRKALGFCRKIHPFSLTDESKYFSGGDRIAPIETHLAKLGIIICYDIRFPEIARKLALEGAELLIVPAQFPRPREHHWHTLLMSRAIENQVFLVGVNRIGGKNPEHFGHSIAIDPYGNVLDELDDKEGILVCEIDLGRIEEVRRAMPVLLDRRPDVYK
ncbi:MAG: carbon-nitrogen family hydrolase [bacterium]